MGNARLAHYLQNSTNVRTFRAAFSDTTSPNANGGGSSQAIYFALSGAANAKVALKHIIYSIRKTSIVSSKSVS